MFCVLDINECVETVHGCSDLCVNELGDFNCACTYGYYLTADKKTCAGQCHVIKWGHVM